MNRNTRYLIPVGILAVLVGFFIVGLQKNPGEIRSPLIGRPAPVFQLESLADPARKIGTGDFNGKAWLLNVWATWCGGCRAEHEALLTIARESGIPLIGLNWRDDRSLALQWLEQLGDPYQNVAFDAEGRVAIDWGVYGAPETFLIGADGKVLHKQIGPLTLEIWRNDFVPLLSSAGAGS